MEPSRNGGGVRRGLARHQDVVRNQVNMGTPVPRCRFGNIYVTRKACIEVLQTILMESIFPVVEAAKMEETPQRPPKMKYQDLPVYANPHADYKQYVADKNSCPGANVKLLHKALLPRVQKLRECSRDIYCDICCGFCDTYKGMRASIVSSKNEFKKTMRDPANIQMRQGVLAAGTLLGFLLGGGGGIPRRVIYTSLGALAAGALCFPKETDEIFREATYHGAKTLLAFYNCMCKKNYAFKEQVPCKDGLPPEPNYKKPVCPPKKN